MDKKPVFVEINPKTNKIEWYFLPNNVLLNALREAKAKFVPIDKGGPYWETFMDYDLVGGIIRKIGKDQVQLGARIEAWAWQEKAKEDTIRGMLAAGDVELSRLPTVLPALAATLRPDQRVGVAFCTLNDSPLIADEMGLGKTLEAIGAIFEAGTDQGATLVICPLASGETVWKYELERWQPHRVILATGPSMNRRIREERLQEVEECLDSGEPFWVVVNPDMVRLVKTTGIDGKVELVSQYPLLHETLWDNIIIDEIADRGVRHPESATAKGMFKLKIRDGGKRIGMTGTPWGGKPVNMWGILHFLHPKQFTSKWRWAFHWLEAYDNGYGTVFEGVRADRKEAFDRHLLKYMIAREKKDVLKNLPPKQRIDVWCDMTSKQKKQYEQFAKMAAIKLGDETLSAASILAEYTRLKQFAGALQEVKEVTEDSMTLRSLPESGKLDMLLDDLVHLGILDRDGRGKLIPGETEQQAVVFSQFSEMVDMLYSALEATGLPILKITGATKGRAEAVKSFQAGEAKVMLMTTQTGGVSITLDRASNVFMMDEMWDPDKQRQAEDRCHRASRIHQVTVRYYRSKDTIEEYIKQVTDRKQDVNRAILDGQIALHKGAKAA